MARCSCLSRACVAVLSSAVLFENPANEAGNNRGDGDNKAGILQRQQPCGYSCRGRGDKHDVEAPAQLVHGFDDVQVAVAKAELDFQQHGETNGRLVSKVDGEGKWLSDVVSPERGGEGQKRDEAKKDEGGEEGARLDFLEQVEELVLEHPEARRNHKGNGECNPVAKGLPDCMKKLAMRDAARHSDLENEQRHGDGEDRVREGFEPVLAVHGVTIVPLLLAKKQIQKS